MYDERRESLTLKDVFLQLLFIILLVFMLIWLFPTKGYLDKKLESMKNNSDLAPLYTRLFTDNILTMQEAAKNYFTTPRLPQNVGDVVKMTLGEMYEKGLLLQLIDSNNNACDATKSYVELTKMEDEYQLKTLLSCSDKEAFIIEYLGCYDYCNGKLCAKPTTVVAPATPNKKYKYQYVLSTGGTCGDFSAWGEWTSNKIEANDNTKVDTKTEKELAGYDKVYGVIDTKYVDEKYNEDVSFGYSTKTIKRTTTYNYTTKKTTTVYSYNTKTTTSTSTVPYAEKTIKKTTLYSYATKTEPKVVPYSTKTTTSTSTIPYAEKTIKRTTTYAYTVKATTVVVPYQQRVSTSDQTFGYSTRTIKRTTTYDYSYRDVPAGVEWVDAGTTEVPGQLSSTDDIHYTPISTREELDCSNACKTIVYTTYKVEKAKTTYTSEKYCAIGENTGAGCANVTYETQNYCAIGEDTGTGCKITKDQVVVYCPEGIDNGSGCAITTTEKYCAKGEDTGSNCQVVAYETQKYCAQGVDNGSGCTVEANKKINYCPEGVDNGSGCAIATSDKYCLQGTDVGNGCEVITFRKEYYCAQGVDNGSSCTVEANQKVYYCKEGTDNGVGCVVVTTEKYCAQGEDTGSNCQVVEYVKQNYCAAGTDTGNGCIATVTKTKKVPQLVYGYKDGDPIYNDVTYYRSKTRTCTGATVDYKWSESDNDADLKNKGYTLTGAKEEIK